MKKFIDPSGNYIFIIPNEWGYMNVIRKTEANAPDSFELYENSIGCFQISCNDKNQGRIPEMISANKLETQKSGTNNLKFIEKYISELKYDLYLWIAVVEDKFIMCKYIYDHEKKDTQEIKDELIKVRACLKTIIVVEQQHKEQILASERFTKFMTAIGATIDLINRAYQNGSSVELVVLLANKIDALLRLTLILKKQLDDNSNAIDTTLIFQKETDRPIMEKRVYDLALKEGIIDQVLYDELYELYNQRNKVIHRYIITDLLTRDVMKTAVRYTMIEDKVGIIVAQYEQAQFKQKIGVYGVDSDPNNPIDDETKQAVLGAIKEKHAHREIIKGMTFN